ncbi:DUF3084 domain-containing protein [Veillonella montpellierensis]|uniref:DUF3084 domain-containing protein n=1 Tax=Veillonella montpellierensis TaxID=187328 RepID=UPI0023F67D1C|nr:DUF3084 domain-containing protein [Veillonella montpellierensis]
MLVGLGVIIILAIMGGLIAYIGDKLGTKVGKRRMSLFGLRPKHTSIIVTIVTGILISACTLGVLTIVSKDVRTALFGMEQLKATMRQLNADIAAKNEQLASGKQLLTTKTKELQTIQNDVQATQKELAEARAARDAMGKDLVSAQEAYEEATQKLEDSHKNIRQLEAIKVDMENHISDLQITQKQLETGITTLREGTVLFRIGETLSSGVVQPGLDEIGSENALGNIINNTNGMILRRLHSDESKSVLYVSRQNVAAVVRDIAASKEPMLVRIIAAGNIIYGEPTLAEIKVYPYRLIFHEGDVIYTSVMQGGGNAQDGILSFLKDVNAQSKAKGILPDTLTGEVGSLSGKELFDTIHKVETMNGPVQIRAVVTDDAYTSGPVHIHLVVTSAS